MEATTAPTSRTALRDALDATTRTQTLELRGRRLWIRPSGRTVGLTEVTPSSSSPGVTLVLSASELRELADALITAAEHAEAWTALDACDL